MNSATTNGPISFENLDFRLVQEENEPEDELNVAMVQEENEPEEELNVNIDVIEDDTNEDNKQLKTTDGIFLIPVIMEDSPRSEENNVLDEDLIIESTVDGESSTDKSLSVYSSLKNISEEQNMDFTFTLNLD